MSKLVILTKLSGCVQCDAVKRHLKKKGIPATVLNGSTPENVALANSLGWSQAPVCIEYAEDGSILDSWSGFNPSRLEDFIPEVPEAVAA